MPSLMPLKRLLSPYALGTQRRLAMEGTGALLGSMRSGAMKGAMIGAGLNAGMSLIDQRNSGQFSLGRTLGAGLRGGLMGGLGGAAFGAGGFVRGGLRPAITPSAQAVTQMGRMARFRNFMTRPRGLNDLSGLGPLRPTMANRMAARRELRSFMRAGQPTWSQRNLPTFGRMGLTATNFGRDVRQLGRDHPLTTTLAGAGTASFGLGIGAGIAAARAGGVAPLMHNIGRLIGL